MSQPHVLIAGAGLGGLTAALAVLQLGFDVDLYEQATELSELGAGVQVSANGARVLYALGLEQALQGVGLVATGKEIRLSNTGQSWKLIDLGEVSVQRYGFPYLTLHRADFQNVLADAVRALKRDAIHLGARVIGFHPTADGVSLDLADGTTTRGDVLVGADGIHSQVRQKLFGQHSPACWRGAD